MDTKIHVNDPEPKWLWRTACGKPKGKSEYHIPLWLYRQMSKQDIIASCCISCVKNILYSDLAMQAVRGNNV